MLNKDLTLFMKRLSRVRKKSSASERKALLEGRKVGNEMSNFCLTQGRSKIVYDRKLKL